MLWRSNIIDSRSRWYDGEQGVTGAAPEEQKDRHPRHLRGRSGGARRRLAVGGSGRRQRPARQSHRDPGLVGRQSPLRRLRHLGHRRQESLPRWLRGNGAFSFPSLPPPFSPFPITLHVNGTCQFKVLYLLMIMENSVVRPSVLFCQKTCCAGFPFVLFPFFPFFSLITLC